MHRTGFALLAALLTAAGCQAPAQAPDEEIAYTFQLSKQAGGPQVSVLVELSGDEDASTDFHLRESWASVEDTRGLVGEPSARGEQERPLEVFQSGSHSWRVVHRPGERIRLSYPLRSGTDLTATNPASYYRVLIASDVFHMIGHVGLIVPTRIDRQQMCRIQVRWEGFAEAGWKVVSSFSADQKGFEIRQPLGRFVHSLFFAGRLRLYPRFVQENLMQFALYGDWKFSDQQFVDMAHAITQAERDFFRDHSQPYFLVTLLPVGDENSGNMGGTGLTNSFALFISPHYSLEGDQGLRVRKLLAHELFHHWNGGLLVREDPGQLIYWFTEGFTDFYARRLLHRAGLMSTEQYADSLNQLLAGYFLSPVRSEPNQRIAEAFWSDAEIKELPYRRGDLVALLLDHEIQRQSAGARSLDDLMREALRRALQDRAQTSTESLLELFAEYTSDGYVQALREVVVQGRMPHIPDDLGAPEVRMEMDDLGRFELGFDYESSRRRQSVQGVVPQSRAWQAGLRNGQLLEGWSLRFGDIVYPVQLTVRDNGVRRQITYLPQSTSTEKVPQIRGR